MSHDVRRSALPAIMVLPLTWLAGCSSGQILSTLSNPTLKQDSVPTRTGIPYYLPEAAIPISISFVPNLPGGLGGNQSDKTAGATANSTSSPSITVNLSSPANSTKDAPSGSRGADQGAAGQSKDPANATSGVPPKGLVVVVGSPLFRADPRLHAFLEYTKEAWADDTFGLHIDAATGLLTTSKGETVDQTGQVAAAIVQTAEAVAKDVAVPVGGLFDNRKAEPAAKYLHNNPDSSSCLTKWAAWPNIPKDRTLFSAPFSEFRDQCPQFATSSDNRKNACYLAWKDADLSNPNPSKYFKTFCPSLDVSDTISKPNPTQVIDKQRCKIGSYKLSAILVPDSESYDSKDAELSIGDYRSNPLKVKSLGKVLEAKLVNQNQINPSEQEIDIEVTAELEPPAKSNSDQLPIDPKEPGILFRDWVPWIVTTTIKPNIAARQACSVVAQIEKVRALIPNGGPFFYEDMSREPLIDKKFSFTISNGMLTGVDVTRPSVLRAIANLPLTIAGPVLAAPFQAVTSGSKGSSTGQSSSTGGSAASAGSP